MIQNNKIDFNSKKTIYKYNSSLYFFFRICIRMNLFLFLVQTSLFLFYVVGNFQKILDNSQKLILNLLAIVSVIEFVFSILCIGLNIATFIITQRKKRKMIFYIFLYIFTLIISVAIFFISRSILLLSNGL